VEDLEGSKDHCLRLWDLTMVRSNRRPNSREPLPPINLRVRLDTKEPKTGATLRSRKQCGGVLEDVPSDGCAFRNGSLLFPLLCNRVGEHIFRLTN